MNGLRGRSMRQRFLQSNPAARPHIVRLPSEGERRQRNSGKINVISTRPSPSYPVTDCVVGRIARVLRTVSGQMTDSRL